MNEPTEQQPPPPGGLSTGMAVVFYGILLALAWLLGVWWLDLDLVEWHDWWETPMWLDAGLGIALGVTTVIATRILEKTTEWARVLGEEFRKILGDLTPNQVFVFAVTSGVAEEVFFRGFLQQALTEYVFGTETPGMILGLVVASLVFGLVHIGPDREKFLPWTIMALVLGVLFGVLYLYTGNILAPLIAHFTINFFNLLHIAGDRDDDGASDADDNSSDVPWNR